jgi:hypothetical protein
VSAASDFYFRPSGQLIGRNLSGVYSYETL